MATISSPEVSPECGVTLVFSRVVSEMFLAETSEESRVVTGASQAYSYITTKWQELTGPTEK